MSGFIYKLSANMNSRKYVLTAFYIATTLLTVVSAHSWLECTDYKGGESDYEKDSCGGYARCGATQLAAGFGADTGFNNEQQGTCQCAVEESTVTTATYTPGQTVCLAYPPKNHVGENIPDGGTTISRTAVNPSGDVFETTYTPSNGFQNCPKFDEDNGAALCTMCFDLESDLEPGEYSFSWEWQFTPGQYYTTCWEATVSGAAGDIESNDSVVVEDSENKESVVVEESDSEQLVEESESESTADPASQQFSSEDSAGSSPYQAESSATVNTLAKDVVLFVFLTVMAMTME